MLHRRHGLHVITDIDSDSAGLLSKLLLFFSAETQTEKTSLGRSASLFALPSATLVLKRRFVPGRRLPGFHRFSRELFLTCSEPMHLCIILDRI